MAIVAVTSIRPHLANSIVFSRNVAKALIPACSRYLNLTNVLGLPSFSVQDVTHSFGGTLSLEDVRNST